MIALGTVPIYEKGAHMFSNARTIIRLLLVAVLVAVSMVRSDAAPEPDTSPLLRELAAQANREGRLLATVQTSWGQAVLPILADAFKRRFGLTIDISLSLVSPAAQFPIEIAATKAGAAPTYDAVEGDDAETMQLLGGGAIEPIPRWRDVLAAINPEVRARKVSPQQISREPFDGMAFLFMANVKQLAYNPTKISSADLPQVHADLADPRFKGTFVQPPWTSHWEVAPDIVSGANRSRMLELVRAAGKNSGAVLFENEGVQRVVLGQYAFVLAQDSYIRDIKKRDPQAPIAGAFFRDYNELNSVYYSVRTRTPHPAAAALWTLWMTSPEAEQIWQAYNQSFVPYGDSPIDVQERDTIKRLRVPVVGYLDNSQMIGYLRWQQTPAGAQYLSAIAKAIRGE